MDNCHFLVKVISNQKIELYYIKHKTNIYIYNYPTCFIANNIEIISYLFSLYDFSGLLSFIHVLYLGKELLKAEIAIFTLQKYVQQ